MPVSISQLKAKADRFQARVFCTLALAVNWSSCLAAAENSPFSDANWISMGGVTGANGPVHAIAAGGSGNLYIGGAFSIVGDVFAANIAKWDGSSWSALGSGLKGAVVAVAVSGSNVYAGSSFTAPGGSFGNYVAKWNGSNWSALG